MKGKLEESGSPDDGAAPPFQIMRHETLLASVDPEIVKAVVKPLLGMGALVFLLVIVSFLPGLDQVIPATPITFSALVIALFSMGIVSVLMYVAPQIEKLMQQKFGGSTALATNAAAIAKHLDVLLAVFIAHWGLEGALFPFLWGTNVVWLYDVVFLLLALIPTAHITRHLYLGLDPAAEFLTRKITSTDSVVTPDSTMAVPPDNQTSETAPSLTTGNGPARPLGSTPLPFVEKVREAELTDRVLRYLHSGPSPDVEVLTKKEHIHRILEEHDGRIQQTAIVELTGWSKSTVSRVLSEMKDEGAIVKANIGQGNLIALPGQEPDSLKSDPPDREA